MVPFYQSITPKTQISFPFSNLEKSGFVFVARGLSGFPNELNSWGTVPIPLNCPLKFYSCVEYKRGLVSKNPIFSSGKLDTIKATGLWLALDCGRWIVLQKLFLLHMSRQQRVPLIGLQCSPDTFEVPIVKEIAQLYLYIGWIWGETEYIWGDMDQMIDGRRGLQWKGEEGGRYAKWTSRL